MQQQQFAQQQPSYSLESVLQQAQQQAQGLPPGTVVQQQAQGLPPGTVVQQQMPTAGAMMQLGVQQQGLFQNSQIQQLLQQIEQQQLTTQQQQLTFPPQITDQQRQLIQQAQLQQLLQRQQQQQPSAQNPDQKQLTTALVQSLQQLTQPQQQQQPQSTPTTTQQQQPHVVMLGAGQAPPPGATLLPGAGTVPSAQPNSGLPLQQQQQIAFTSSTGSTGQTQHPGTLAPPPPPPMPQQQQQLVAPARQMASEHVPKDLAQLGILCSTVTTVALPPPGWTTTTERGTQPALNDMKLLHGSGLAGKVSFVSFDCCHSFPDSMDVGVPRSELTKIFVGQLPYHMTEKQLSWLAYTFGGARLCSFDRITRTDHTKPGTKIPTGCYHCYVPNSDVETLLRLMEDTILCDDIGVWCAQSEKQKECLVKYCLSMKSDPSLRFLQRPYGTVVMQHSTSTFDSDRATQRANKKKGQMDKQQYLNPNHPINQNQQQQHASSESIVAQHQANPYAPGGVGSCPPAFTPPPVNPTIPTAPPGPRTPKGASSLNQQGGGTSSAPGFKSMSLPQPPPPAYQQQGNPTGTVFPPPPSGVGGTLGNGGFTASGGSFTQSTGSATGFVQSNGGVNGSTPSNNYHPVVATGATPSPGGGQPVNDCSFTHSASSSRGGFNNSSNAVNL